MKKYTKIYLLLILISTVLFSCSRKASFPKVKSINYSVVKIQNRFVSFFAYHFIGYGKNDFSVVIKSHNTRSEILKFLRLLIKNNKNIDGIKFTVYYYDKKIFAEKNGNVFFRDGAWENAKPIAYGGIDGCGKVHAWFKKR